MKEFTKKINDQRNVTLSFYDGNVLIRDEYSNGKTYNSYDFIVGNDFSISAYCDDIDSEELTFTIDIDHPLYYPLLHFLRNDNQIKINCDTRRDEYDDICYISIAKEEEMITIHFVNHIPKIDDFPLPFNYVIINTMHDGRSKLDSRGTDIKDRLHIFFKEVIQLFTEEYHQITIEEYVDSVKRLTRKPKKLR